MPDTLSLTAGVSLGLLAGIVSGVCYFVANNITWPNSRSERSGSGRCPSSASDEGICLRCGGDKQGGVIPCICYHNDPVRFESGAWFLRQVQRAATLMPWSISTDKLEQIEEEQEGRGSPGPSRQDQATIREFLETLAAKLAGGPLEGTPVAPLYHHPAYVRLCERYHAPLRRALAALATALRDALTHLPPLRNASPSHSGASSARPSSGASSAHVQLKRLVARVVEEAAALPALARYAAEPSEPTIESSTYEDLLATAILNKVIERYQNENGSGGRSSGIHSASASPTPSERSSPRSLNSRTTRDITPPLHEDDVSDWEEGEATDEALEVPRRVPFPEFGGDIVHTTDNEEREFDEVSSSDLQATDGTWEENWLFQKKKIKTSQSVPVPMLVPNSNTEYRALIGDRDADDTTDLSDNASDDEEQSEVAEYKSDIKKVLDSKHIIGGKTKIETESDFEPDSLTIENGAEEFEKLVGNEYNDDKAVDDIINEINDNTVTIVDTKNVNASDEVDGMINGNDSVILMGIDEGPLLKAEFNLKEEIHRSLMNGNAQHFLEDVDTNEEVFDDSIESMAINKESTNNTMSHHEREGEYEETVSIPVQRYADSLRRKHFEDASYEIHATSQEHNNNDNEDELIPGSIAYRERKKWLNYVEMPNNPYSPEAIQKRLSTKSTSSLFDIITTKNKDLEEETVNTHQNMIKRENVQNEEHLDKEIKTPKLSLVLSSGNDKTNERRSQSPSPKVLKDVLAEDILQYKRYGRDYYIREAKASSGGRKKNSFSDASSVSSSMNKSTSLDNFDAELASPGLLIQQINNIATNQQYTKFANQDQIESITTTSNNNKTEILIEYEDHNEQTLFSARPAVVDDDTDKKFDEIILSAYKSEITVNDTEQDKIEEPIKSPVSVANSYISTSSLEDSIKIYNVQTGEVIKCRPEDNISARYETTPDSNENIDIRDKNIPGDIFGSFSQNGDSEEEAVIVEESDKEKLGSEERKLDSELEDILSRLPKVKELAKKFVSMDNVNEPVKVPQPQTFSKRRISKENILNDMNAEKPNKIFMHSLTARSISKEFREELKLSMATPLTVPGGSKEIPDGEEVIKESSRPGSPLPEPGTIKTKLAFFESLKNKFNGK